MRPLKRIEKAPVGGVAFVPLGRGRYARVDEVDEARVRAHLWGFNGRYVCGRAGRALHRFILEPPPGLGVGFKSPDKLDCRRSNLRLRPGAGGAGIGRRLRADNACGFKGVRGGPVARRPVGGWCARIYEAGREVHLGTFSTPEEAARAYDVAARRIHGDRALLNFPGPGEAPARASLR